MMPSGIGPAALLFLEKAMTTTAYDDQFSPDEEFGEEADNEMERRKDQRREERDEA